jgi:putative transposase
MSHHYVNQLIHIMWSTENQAFTFSKPQKSELHAYITELVKTLKGIVLFTGGVVDHIHLLIKLSPEISLSGLMKHIKSYSSKWLRSHQKVPSDFSWQTGYAAISTQIDRIEKVCDYIRSDESRHLSMTLPQLHIG